MDKEWEDVRKFQEFVKQPVRDTPHILSYDRVKIRYKWLLEEINEFLEAENDIVEQADAMIDVIYFALGALVEMGIKPDSLFQIVHQANMSKIWADGEIHYDSDGKVQKPDSWTDPYKKLEQAINTNYR
ncbi:MAG: HAD family hydrolase [Turicibacter sp.]|nr:HAD family hydrolase [Turicibacter sp.]